MSLEGKVIAVLGATGNVGAAIVELFDKEGAKVYGTSRSEEKFESVRKEYGWSDKVKYAQSDFSTDEAAVETASKIMKLTGGKLLHVVSNIGFATIGKSALEYGTEDMLSMINNELLPSFRASQAFIKELGNTEGSTVTLTAGGFGYGLKPTMSSLYGGSIKNAILMNLATCFDAAIVDDGLKTSAQVVSIFYGVSRKGEKQNQWGFPADESSGLGSAKAFLAALTGKFAGQIMDMKKPEDGEKFLKESSSAK